MLFLCLYPSYFLYMPFLSEQTSLSFGILSWCITHYGSVTLENRTATALKLEGGGWGVAPCFHWICLQSKNNFKKLQFLCNRSCTGWTHKHATPSISRKQLLTVGSCTGCLQLGNLSPNNCSATLTWLQFLRWRFANNAVKFIHAFKLPTQCNQSGSVYADEHNSSVTCLFAKDDSTGCQVVVFWLYSCIKPRLLTLI